MKFTIHRGTKEIGGSCVELRAGGSRIILDIGMPLMKPGGLEFDIRDYDGVSGEKLCAEGVLPAVDGLYQWQTPTVDAILISHAHMDHYGLLDHVHPDIPVWLSEGTRKLIEITTTFSGKPSPLRTTKEFSWPSRFEIGAFTITPHLVDHSSFSSFAFEVEGVGKRLFYSGDFREHGHIGKALDILYEKVAPGMDALLMEGTMMGRSDEGVLSESDLSLAATDICKRCEKAVLVYQAGQNISRAVSFYKAAKRTGRLFVLDVYMAHVMKELSECPGGEKLPRPGHPGFDDVRVWYPRYLTNRLFRSDLGEIPIAFSKSKITKEQMASDLGKVMLFVRPWMQGDIRRIQGIEGSTLVYSLWEGYKAKDGTRQFLEELEGMGIAIETLHTSGHADLPALRRMVDRLKPKRTIPIHTLHPDAFSGEFGSSVEAVASGDVVAV